MEWVEKKNCEKGFFVVERCRQQWNDQKWFFADNFFHSIFWGERFFEILNDRIGFSDHTMTIVLSKMTGRYLDKQP